MAPGGTVRLEGEIRVKGQKPVMVRNVYASQRDGGLLTNAALDMGRSFGVLWDTPFSAPPEMEITVNVTVDNEPLEE